MPEEQVRKRQIIPAGKLTCHIAILLLFLIMAGRVMGEEPPDLKDQLKKNWDKADPLFLAEEYDQALAIYSESLALDGVSLAPGTEENLLYFNTIYRVGWCYLRLEKLDLALEEWQRVREAFPKWDMIHLNIAHIYNVRGDIDGAIALLEEFLREREDTASVYYELSFYHRKKENWKKLYSYAQRAYAKDPSHIAKSYSSAYHIASTHVKAGEYADAFVWYSRVFAHAQESDGERIEELVGELDEIRPVHPVAGFFLWNLYKTTDTTDEKRDILESLRGDDVPQLLEGFYGHPELAPFGYYSVGCFLSALGEVDLSLKFLRKAFASSVSAKDKIQKDPDLLAIREHPDYERILESFDQLVMRVQGGHTGAVMGICFGPDGHIYTAGDDNTLRIWKPDGRLIKTIEAHEDKAYSVDISPDGKTLVTAGGDKSLKLWSVDGQLIWKMSGHGASVRCAKYHPDGTRIVSVGWDGTIRIWSALGRLLKTKTDVGFGNCIDFSPDGKFFVTGHQDGKVRIWSEEGALLKILEEHDDSVTAVDFAPDGTFLTASRDETLKHWRPDGSLIRVYEPGHAGARSFYSACFSQDGRHIVGVTLSNANVWDVDTGENICLFLTFSTRIAAFNQEGVLFTGNILWHINGERILELGREIEWRMDVEFSSDGELLFSAGFHGDFQIWGTDGRLIRSLDTLTTNTVDYGNGGTIVIGGWDGEIQLWNIQGKLIKRFDAHERRVKEVAFRPDGQVFASIGNDGLVKLWSSDGAHIRTIDAHDKAGRCLVFSPSGRYLASGSEADDIRIWDKDGELLATWNLSIWPGNLCFSPDESVLMSLDGREINLWTLEGERLTTIYDDHLAHAVFSPGDERIVTGCEDGHIRIWNYDGDLLSDLEGHSSAVKAVAVSPRGNLFASGGYDGVTFLWNGESYEKIGLLAHGGEWIAYSSDGYFSSSISGDRLVAMTKGLEVFGMEQFALTQNRPDILLERIGCENEALITHYESLYRKRLRKSGLTESGGSGEIHVPNAEILRLEQEGKMVDLHFRLWDDSCDLISYNIHINNVPIYGAFGKPLRRKRIELAEKIELTQGFNKIEVSCTNEMGAESFRSLRFASYEESIRGDLYFLGFGVSRYQDSSLNLGYADKDVTDLAELFRGMERRYKKIHIHTYLNDEVTPECFREAKIELEDASVDDTLVLFIAGHGLHDDTLEATYYYLTHEADLDDLAGSCADFELIEDILQGIAPRNKLFLIDTCESGEVEEDAQQQYTYHPEDQGISPRGFNIVTRDREIPRRTYLYEKNRYIYNDLSRRSGAIVFSSSRGGEFSYELEAFENGIFTEAILVGLGGGWANQDHDYMVSVDELRAYVSRFVAEKTDDLQHPAVDRDNIYQKFGFPIF